MNPETNFALFLAVSTLLLIPAKKWAGMDPLHIEEGPSWSMAALGAVYTMVLFILAMTFSAQQHEKMAGFFGSFAFGSAIGGCFQTAFKPNRSDVSNSVLRWWVGQLNSIADGLFKGILVIPVGWVISWLTNFDGPFWAAVTLALALVVAKTGIAIQSLHSETDTPVRKERDHMLIQGNVLLTMIVGVSCLISWLVLAKPVMSTWQHFTAHDYLSVAGLILGIGLHF